MATTSALNAVEQTCLLTAACRCEAVRHAEPASPLRALDASFDERIIAELHAQPPSTLMPEDHYGQGDARFFASRALELDALLGDAAGAQVVLLGVGMDPRPWRMRWPGEGPTVYEVDSPAVLALRERGVAPLGPPPACRRVPVVADLSDWDGTVAALRHAGLQPDQPVVWLAEGLLGYLADAQLDALFAGMSAASAPGSTFITSCPPAPEFRKPWMTHATYEEAPRTMRRAEAAGWALRLLLPTESLVQKYAVPFLTALAVFSR